jgi:hypothetical protein
MEVMMLKGSFARKLITLILLITIFGISGVGARVVASETIVIRAFIPERTTVSYSEAGEVFFSSNVPSALVDVSYMSDATLLSVIAR